MTVHLYRTVVCGIMIFKDNPLSRDDMLALIQDRKLFAQQLFAGNKIHKQISEEKMQTLAFTALLLKPRFSL